MFRMRKLFFLVEPLITLPKSMRYEASTKSPDGGGRLSSRGTLVRARVRVRVGVRVGVGVGVGVGVRVRVRLRVGLRVGLRVRVVEQEQEQEHLALAG